VKLLPHILLWKSITADSILVSLIMIPGVIAGLLIGRALVKRIPEKPYRLAMMIMTLFASLLLFL